MKTLIKGESKTLRLKFKTGVTFPSAPAWNLKDWNDNVLLSGAATLQSGSTWQAAITVPTTLVIPDGAADLTLEMEGTDSTGKLRSISAVVPVVDASDTWQTFGLLYLSPKTSIKDTVIFPVEPDSIKIDLQEGYNDGPTLDTVTINDPSYQAVTNHGFAYRLTLPLTTPLTNQSGNGHYPYHLVFTATLPDGSEDIVAKPVQVMTRTAMTRVNSVKRFLDKARLDEIDPNLQWHDEELIHFLMQAAQNLNGFGGATTTFWTLNAWPPSIINYLDMEACFLALNARFLAEGLNSFEFNSANVQLSFQQRIQFIQTKMEELRSRVDQYWPAAKTGAIRSSGVGTPPPDSGTTNTKRSRIGALGVQYGPMTNRSYMGIRIRGTGWRY